MTTAPLDRLRSGDLALWSSPDALVLALSNPLAAAEGARKVDSPMLPLASRPLWRDTMRAWWSTCQDPEAMLDWIDSEWRRRGQRARRRARRAAIVCARSVLPLVGVVHRHEVDRLLSLVYRWARYAPRSEPPPQVASELRRCFSDAPLNNDAAEHAALAITYDNPVEVVDLVRQAVRRTTGSASEAEDHVRGLCDLIRADLGDEVWT